MSVSPAPCWDDRCADDVMLIGNRAGRGREKRKSQERGRTAEDRQGQGRGKKQGWRRIWQWQPSACSILTPLHGALAFDLWPQRVGSGVKQEGGEARTRGRYLYVCKISESEVWKVRLHWKKADKLWWAGALNNYPLTHTHHSLLCLVTLPLLPLKKCMDR